MESAKKYIKHIFDVRDDTEEAEKIIGNIRKYIEFHGSTLWMLVFAIVIASVGLNINSISIIIGAMLISPLMGPIIGLGLSIGINDRAFLKKSIKNLFIATAIGIIISALYFYISPIGTAQSELLARTNPTFYDIIIAFFGGFAGVLGITRSEKGNVIPGVAIATALMPPLCTVGYGIATGQPAFFFGAFYLYAINCIFICLATLIGVKYLKLPSVAYINQEQKAKTEKLIAFVVVLMAAPAMYFAFLFVKENNFNQNVQLYIQNEFSNKGYVVIYKNVDFKNLPHTIELAFLSKHFSQSEISNLENDLVKYDLVDTHLVIKQDNASLTEKQWNDTIANMKNESEKIRAIEAKIYKEISNSDKTNQMTREAHSINNKIIRIEIGEPLFQDTGTSTALKSIDGSNGIVFFVKTDSTTTATSTDLDIISKDEQDGLSAWAKIRMQNENLNTYFIKDVYGTDI